ncbi:MAG: ABC transporter ATP-binding protein [Firmicutes bacterium]|nr:ABC transporter ATP-binding protein [Bacillota bacterium]
MAWGGAPPSSPDVPVPAAAIEVRGLSKSFGDVRAVAGVDFTVGEGELFGLLGPNGAGKTTTINMLTGLARPDSGTISIGGMDCSANPKAAQHLIGVVPDESNLYPELTGFENLVFCGALYGLRKREREDRARELLEMFGLSDAADRRFAGYSKGMKRKLTLAAGIIHRPPVLFLDEPTTGIDVASARRIRQLIADLHRSGTTILLTTHYIEEAERLCDRIAFMVSGRIVHVDSVENLLQPVRRQHALQLSVSDGGQAARAGDLVAAAFPDMSVQVFPGGRIRLEGPEPIPVGPLAKVLEGEGITLLEAVRLRPSLEDVFVRITGVEAEVMRRDRLGAGAGGRS